MSHVRKQPYLFSNRLMDMVSRDIDEGVARTEWGFRSSGQVFEDVLKRVEKFTMYSCGMDAAEITQDEFNDARERLIVKIKKLIKYDMRVRHVRAMRLRWERAKRACVE